MKTTLKLSLLAAASILAACGGGGGGSTTAVTPAPVVTVAGNLATSVPTPTYAAASTELALFNELNAVRLAGGFGMLAQDPMIDKASTSHARYVADYFFLMVNGQYPNILEKSLVDPATNTLNAHIEKPSVAGFTGITVSDRVTVAGAKYAYIGEGNSYPLNRANCVADLLNTVFHRSGLLNTAMQNVGFGLQTAVAGDNICIIGSGYKTAGNIRPSAWVGIYPGAGQTNVPVVMRAEAPDPAPDVPDASKGTPVTIYLESKIGTVNSFTLTAAGSATPVQVKQIVQANFPLYVTDSEVHILPTQPLAKGTVYTASFSGTLASGTNVNKTWSFTTTVN